MAIHAPITGALSCATKVEAFTDSLGETLTRLDRGSLEDVIEFAIDLLDAFDDDPDIEPNGDELDGTAAEDDFISHNYSWRREPGCPISDPDWVVGVLPKLPRYGIDQSAGPTNEVEAVREWQEAEIARADREWLGRRGRA
ncbi:hypothetical protein SAMN06295912_13626 [Sphingomonas laterariae]|uniref:Uncharacterized protein n=1 Tax=Edaphosphingomonas laterariae TaxID=861865 RepID=A0A239JMN4_9SPHN|nr:hypothetical protein [Sphingomonas laterariae]SNT07286.1 hypothetical protein SAMN06295912_13626 [Sphingomonas laterariae]